MDLSKYEEIFRSESERYLSQLDELVSRADSALADAGIWSEIHGKIHSIKGMARALSLDAISGFCHHVESWCKAFQSGQAAADRTGLETVEEAVELLKLLVARKGEVASPDTQQWYSKMTARLEKGPAAAGSREPDRPARRPVRVKPIDEVRVRYSLIEELLGLGQEIQMLEKTIPPLPDDDTMAGIKGWIDQAMALMRTFFFRLSHLRLMPIEDFMALFTHAIKRIARDADRKVALEVAGGEIQADVTLLERLREPLIHLLRNCIAHGIESPQERITAGKPETGRIRVAASTVKERLRLEISDDGKGIDPGPIRTFLGRNRKMTPEQIDAMSEGEVLRTILEPDYSSMKTTTDIAGRGVGMSVVAQAVEHMGGSLGIRSKTGGGSTFIISMPLSLSIIYAVTFRIGPYVMSIPTSAVASIRTAAEASEEQIAAAVDLKQYLESQDRRERVFTHLIGLKPGQRGNGGGVSGILTDDIVGNRPLMVMPIREPLSQVGLYAGVGVLENGDLSMVVDPAQLKKLRQG